MKIREFLSKNKYKLILSIIGLLFIGIVIATPNITPKLSTSVPARVFAPISITNNSVSTPPLESSNQTAKEKSLSNDNYYINSSGEDIHSPAYSENSEIPVGATARCGDSTYSFSQHRSGTCSHHGGVASWL